LRVAIHWDRNLYPRVNPHLNSFLLDEDGGWESFHASHIVDIARELDTQLPANYYAIAEKSLQISAIGLEEEIRHRTEPDVTIYQRGKTAASAASLMMPTAPTATLPLAGEFQDDEEDLLTAVVIYRIESGKLPGNAVTRIELLSPANKPAGSYYRQYLAKRRETLRGGLCLVEIDYLHETRPISHLLPSYPDNHQTASPYIILVSDPRPTPQKGEIRTYPFGIDDTMPIVEIPLAQKENVLVDFGAIYNRTFESSRVFRLIVNYEQEPANFQHYNDADQERIRQHMRAIAEKYKSNG
jgi:hypothetical protein